MGEWKMSMQQKKHSLDATFDERVSPARAQDHRFADHAPSHPAGSRAGRLTGTGFSKGEMPSEDPAAENSLKVLQFDADQYLPTLDAQWIRVKYEKTMLAACVGCAEFTPQVCITVGDSR
ncbi:hypothetical protein M8818_004361 [Zalaria obscura]|uniref:Uncharacterized protein n=1 Tax=Zalaria obscura TaxID=2024903 RepID=A0ACC3SBC5_9PEZI